MTNNSYNFSYWEQTAFLNEADVIIIGSGLVGLSAALSLKRQQPMQRITVLERGFLPSGASTKNAGFACFGTVSEQLAMVQESSEDEMIHMVDYKYRGLKRLRANLGDNNIRYEQHGGYELFTGDEKHPMSYYLEGLPYLNKVLSKVVGSTDIYAVVDHKINGFGFQGVNKMIVNRFEGQIDTGRMMRVLLHKVYQAGILVLNSCDVTGIENHENSQRVFTNRGYFLTKRVVLANNAFANQLYPELDVTPGRGQVLITKPITNLKLRGTYHIEQGYYYFRNVDNRVLFGGGRNLDLKAEETTEFGHTELVHQKLKSYLNEMILPGQNAEVDYWWSGIMGFGQTGPIVKQLKPNVFCAIRCNGMGIAMGSLVGEEVAELVLKS